jgi:hypothetical protein
MAKTPGTEILSPIGKLVQGSVFELSDKIDDKTKQPVRDEHGNIVKTAYFAIAIDKTNPEWPAFWTTLVQVASGGYPQFFVNGNMPGLKDFAYKVTDGDGFDKNGKPNNQKPGFAGCWVVKFSSTFLPRCYEKGKYAPIQQLQDPRSIKPGYFVRVSAIARPNIGAQSAGLYLNADMVELNFVGEEIVFGRDAGAAFGAQQATFVPQGAMQLGTAMQPQGGMPGGQMPQGGMPQGGMPGGQMQPQGGMPGAGMPMGGQMPQAGQMPQGGAAMGGMQPGMAATPGTAVQPNGQFVQGAMQQAGVMPQGGAPMGGQMPQGMGTPMQTQQTPQYAPTEKAQGYTLQQYLDNGFNIQQLLQEGRFVQVA